MSKKIRFLVTGAIILALFIGYANAVPNPLPGKGNHTLILYGVHPNAKSNEIITSFLAEHPDIRWHESAYNETYEYVYITPVNECSDQLVYLNKIGANERSEPSIASVRIIGCDKILPLDPIYQFPEIFENYSSLAGDRDLQYYIEDNLPSRCTEVEKSDPETDVYFIDDAGTFTEYIVTIKKGLIMDEVACGTFISEDYFTINKSEAQSEAVDTHPGWNLTGNTILKIDDNRAVWEIPVSNGSVEDIISIPTELLEDYSIIKKEPITTPGFDLLVTAFSIGIGFIVIAGRRG